MDSLAGLKAFVRVVELGNFSEAGRVLKMAPSSVSRQIAQLEDQLDVQLFNRTTRSVHLTEAGELYYERVSRILIDLENSARLVSDIDHQPRGKLKVNVPIGFGSRHIIPMVTAYLVEFPEVDLDLSLSDNMVDIIEEGLDLVIRVGALRDSSLIARKLAENHRALVASPEYLLEHGRPTSLDDLSEHSCLVYSHFGSRNHWHAAEKLEGGAHGPERVFPVSGRMVVNNSDALYQAAQTGLGLAILPTWIVGEDIKSGTLIEVLPEFDFSPTEIETAIYALYPPTRHMSGKVRSFLDFLSERIGRPPYWERETSFMYL